MFDTYEIHASLLDKMNHAVLNQLRGGKVIEGFPMRINTFKELLDLVDERDKAARMPSYRTFFRRIADQLEAHFGGMEVRAIGPFEIERYKTKKFKEGCQGSTVNRHLAVLNKVFVLGKKWKLVESNPVEEVEMERESPGRQVFLTPQQEGKLLEACPPHLKIPVRLALRFGMRKGDLLSLKAGQVDLSVDRLFIMDAKTRTPRFIPIPWLEKPLLASLVDRVKAEQGLGLNPDGFLFLTRLGSRYSEGGFRKEFAKAIRSAGLGDFRWHDLRHCCASDLINSGASLEVVSKVLGHKQARTTQRYAHLSLSAMRTAFADREKWLQGQAA